MATRKGLYLNCRFQHFVQIEDGNVMVSVIDRTVSETRLFSTVIFTKIVHVNSVLSNKRTLH